MERAQADGGSRAGTQRKKLTIQLEKVNREIARFSSLTRTHRHPCDRSELGHQLKLLRERAQQLEKEIANIDNETSTQATTT